MYFILVDAGRTGLVGGDMHEMLRCIRCGACMNHCPVYKTVGGHAYGWVYPGPMGAVLTPAYVGPGERARPAARGDAMQPVRSGLPRAHSRCPSCCASCARSRSSGICGRRARWRRCARGRGWRSGRGLYAFATRWAARALRLLGGRTGRIRRLPGARGWTLGRDFPAPQRATFRDQYKRSKK